VQKRIGHHVNALLHDRLKEARPESPRKGEGLIDGLTSPRIGKEISHDLDA